MNEAITTEDAEKIKEAVERLKTSSMEIGKAIYSQQNEESSAPEGEGEQKPEEPAAEEEKKDEEKNEEKKEK